MLEQSTFSVETPNGEEVTTLREAAKFLRMSRSHLLNIVNRKIKNLPPLPHSRVGRRLLFRRTALEKWLRDAESATATGTGNHGVNAE
jgi:excisionase family DNA binding protein